MSKPIKLHKPLLEIVKNGLHEIFNNGIYADKEVQHILLNNKQFGSRDRSFIAETIYDIVRWKRNYEQLMVNRKWSIGNWNNYILISLLNRKKEIVNTPQNLLELLLKENIDAKITNPTALEKTGFYFKNCIEISSKNNLKNSTFYKSGFFEFQDLGSQLIGEFCDLKSNQTVLDLCAGAGGKSLHLSAILQNKGKIYATDFKPERTKTLANRANNAGCKNIEIISFEKAMFLKNLDVVLIDAPCSGIGTIKRNPDVKWKLKNNDIDNYKTIQAALLEKYNSLIHKDGKLIYATCSILPSESELQIQHFLKNNPDFELVKEIKLSPAIYGVDGFYMAEIGWK